LALPAAKLRMSCMRCRSERGRACLPAALLDARNRDACLAARGDEDAHVQDPVLLRAEELLAVEQEHVLVERVLDRKLRHRTRRVDLGNAKAEWQRLLERDVVG